MRRITRKNLRLLLFGGVISAPFFFAVSIVQMFTRTGFDIRRHAISTLTLGDFGWIQSANFIITGSLVLLTSIGVRSLLKEERNGTWGPLLIGLYGLGMIFAGVFRPDPGQGFPAGAPEGIPASMSLHAVVHSLAFFTAFICLISACFVFTRWFTRDRGWRIYCIVTGIVSPLLIMLGMGMNMWIGVIMGCAGLVAFGWVSILAARLHYEMKNRVHA